MGRPKQIQRKQLQRRRRMMLAVRIVKPLAVKRLSVDQALCSALPLCRFPDRQLLADRLFALAMYIPLVPKQSKSWRCSCAVDASCVDISWTSLEHLYSALPGLALGTRKK